MSSAWACGVQMVPRGRMLCPKTGTVKSDNAILSRGGFDHAARFEILDHAAVAVQEHDRLTGPPNERRRRR
jgi:hypothetical protein